MTSRLPRWAIAAAGAILLASSVAPVVVAAPRPKFDHVLLISVDGLHASDVQQCLSDGLCPNLAALSAAGTTYARASSSSRPTRHRG